MGEIGIAIAIIAGVILGMVLLNKLLEYLFYKFTIVYNLVLVVIAVLSNLPLILQGVPEEFPAWYAGVQVLFFYLQWTRCDSSEWTTVEGSAHYNEYTNTIHAEAHEESHYRPGWWNKLILVAICTGIALLLSILIQSPVITLVVELILPLWTILTYLRSRR